MKKIRLKWWDFLLWLFPNEYFVTSHMKCIDELNNPTEQHYLLKRLAPFQLTIIRYIEIKRRSND